MDDILSVKEQAGARCDVHITAAVPAIKQMAQQQPTKFFCRHCGHSLEPQAVFCSHCGRPRQVQTNSAASRRRTTHLVVGLAAVGVILLTAVILLFAARIHPGAAALDLGKSIVLMDQVIPADGGQIILEDPSSGLNGLTLDVPSGTFEKDQDFTIRAAPIESHRFGELFQAASPLITIDNGHQRASELMTLTIPIEQTEDEFALAFYYDAADGSLEGIPCISQDTRTITVATAHFSSIVVSKVKKSLLEGRILEDDATTDFLPGMSDFAAPNHGSIIAPSGHCTGQSLAAIHFYNMNAHGNDSGRTLRGEDRVDNGPMPATPAFWEDDALVYRFCSLLQKTFTWDAAVKSDLFNMTEEVAYYSFGYAMALTHSPQIIIIYGTDDKGNQAGHAMVVYEVDPDGLDIADPNYPGNLIRKIDRVNDPLNPLHPVTLADYLSGLNADDPGTIFTSFTYFGTYALFDFDKIDALWQDVLAGKDVAGSLFPADPAFVALTDQDEQGNPIVTTLKSQLSISPQQIARANPLSPDTLPVSVPTADPDAKFTFYRAANLIGTASANLGQNTGDWFPLPLIAGIQDIGILYERKDSAGDYQYVNFYRYSISYDGTEPTPASTSESKTAAEPAYAGKWELTDLKIIGISGGTDAFWKDITFSGSTKENWVDHYVGDFNDFLAHSSSYGPSVTYMTEISIGLPVPPVSDLFTDKLFFQFNHVDYIGDFDVVFDGQKQNYRRATIPAEPLDEKTLRVYGYEGCGGLDPDDMLLDLTLTFLDDKSATGTGTTLINVYEGGKIEVAFSCTMQKTADKPNLEPEYESP